MVGRQRKKEETLVVDRRQLMGEKGRFSISNVGFVKIRWIWDVDLI